MKARVLWLSTAVIGGLIGLAAFETRALDAQVMTSQQMPARDAQVAPTGPGRITGVLVTDETDPKPVRRAEVRAVLAGASPRTAITDANGRFSFEALPYGRYTIEATKAGYVRVAYGARRWDRAGTPITLGPGSLTHDLSMRLPRGAAITGRIVDEFGAPALGARGNVQMVRTVNGERSVQPILLAGAVTSDAVDDRGQFRLYGLPPGDYVVSAQPRMVGTGDIGRLTDAEIRAAEQAIASMTPTAQNAPPPPTTLGFSQVFYPGANNVGGAVPITLQSGEERTNIDFPIALVRTAAIEGMVVVPGDVNPASVQLSLTLKSDMTATEIAMPAGGTGNVMMFTSSSVTMGGRRVNADGTFTYGGVAPGAYVLSARANRQGGAVLWAETDVIVDGSTVSGVSLALQEGLTLTGRLVADADGVDAPENWSRARINLIPASLTGGAAMMMGNNTTVTPEGTFTIRNVVPGRYRMVANFSSPEATWQTKSAVFKGVDALDGVLEVSGQEPLGEGVVTFTNRTQELNGTLSDATQRPATEYTVVLFPTDKAQWLSSRRFRTARPGTDGKFSFTGIPAGVYRLAAVTDIGQEELRDFAILQELVPASLEVRVGDGEKKVQDLRIAR